MDISIIIPTHNRKGSLRKCLDSLWAQDYPRDRFEILVVDDGSTDGTKQMLDELSQTSRFLRWFSQPHKGPAAARNLGLKEASSDIVGFTDDDCVLEKDWVSKMTQAHREDRALAVGGRTKVAEHNIRARVSQFLSDGAIQTKIDAKTEVIFFPTCNVSLKKSLLQDDSFNESFPLPAGEDLDFFWRLFKKGHRLVYREDIVVFHDCHPGPVSFLRQAYRYGRGNYLVQYLHKDQPLLKELKTGSRLSFWAGTVANFLKIPRFAVLCGRPLIASEKGFSLGGKLKVYGYLTLHKIMYLWGNIVEHGRLGKRGGLDRSQKPDGIIFDITHRCNLACNICEIRKDGAIKELSTAEVQRLIVETKNWGIKDFVFSGGEALLREDIFEIIEFSGRIGYRTLGVLTNGILLDEVLIKRLTPYLSTGMLSLTISLDALTPGIHDDIRGAAGSHERTLRALKMLSLLKKSTPLLNFNVISILLNTNLEEVSLLADFLKSLNVGSMQVQPLLANNLVMNARSSRVKYWIPVERFFLLDKAVDSLIDFKIGNPGFLRNSENNLRLMKKYFRGQLDPRDVECQHGSKTLLISHGGEVAACFAAFGDVRKQSLKDIYYSSRASLAREAVKKCKNPCLLPCFCDI